MPCYKPIHGYRSKQKSVNGKYYFTMNPQDSYRDLPMSVPCGQCIGCKLDRSKSWAVRCVHEASLYTHNCFITLTYADDPLSLNVKHFQKFMKRLRRRFPGRTIRFFHCGEYGTVCYWCGMSEMICKQKGCGKFRATLGRPHYHACLFNFAFTSDIVGEDDAMYLHRIDPVTKSRLYRSNLLERIWSHGFSTIGEVNFESAAYVARYVVKKFTNTDCSRVSHHYGLFDHDTGCLVVERSPEYVTMSRNPGIAFDWFKKYYKDVYPHDYVVIRDGIKVKPPKYYDTKYDIVDPDALADIKSVREASFEKRKEDNTEKRLKEKEIWQKGKLKHLGRSLENDPEGICRV